MAWLVGGAWQPNGWDTPYALAQEPRAGIGMAPSWRPFVLPCRFADTEEYIYR